MKQARHFYPWLGVLTLWGALFCLSCRFNMAAIAGHTPGRHPSVSGKMLGVSRIALSQYCLEMADLYFHKGVGIQRREAFENSFTQKLFKEISPRSHVHREGADIQELMPWLLGAMRLDPDRVDNFTLTAFWLAGQDAGRPDLAHDVLRQAKIHNPRNYELYLEEGRIFVTEMNTAKARQEFDAGLALWPGREDPGAERAQIGKESLLRFKALLQEIDGETQPAIETHREILKFLLKANRLEDMKGTITRIKELMRDGASAVRAPAILDAMLKAMRDKRSACSREEREHDPGRP